MQEETVYRTVPGTVKVLVRTLGKEAWEKESTELCLKT